MSRPVRIEAVVDPNWDQNCYLVWDEAREAVVIDPGFQWSSVLARIQELSLRVTAIVNTHGHLDHIAGNAELQAPTGAPILIHPGDRAMLVDPTANFSLLLLGTPVVSPPPSACLEEGVPAAAGRFQLVPLHTPGHSPGSVSLVLEKDGVRYGVFSGDALFAGSIGRTDFPGTSHEELVASIRQKLMTLPDELEVYPGHGPMTTIGAERAHNPFIL